MRRTVRLTTALGHFVPAFVAATIFCGTIASAATISSHSSKKSPHTNQETRQTAGETHQRSDQNQIVTLGLFHTWALVQGTNLRNNPDDITTLGGHIFVAFQNGVGSTGEASSTGAKNSTIVEYDSRGIMLHSWNITGKCDGLTADPANHRIVATVNEDGDSSMYIIHLNMPQGQQIQHITYVDPASSQSGTLSTGGGTDSIAIQNGNIYLSASAPADSTHAAVFKATLSGNTATLTPIFMDDSPATDASTGNSVTLNLTDPDSSTLVPSSSPRFSKDLMLDSQGDSQLIFVDQPGTAQQSLTRLSLGTQVDDVSWATSTAGTLYVTDSGTNKVDAISGKFSPGTVFVACPGDSGVAGFVGTLDLKTGTIHPFAIGMKDPHGLLFVPQTKR